MKINKIIKIPGVEKITNGTSSRFPSLAHQFHQASWTYSAAQPYSKYYPQYKYPGTSTKPLF